MSAADTENEFRLALEDLLSRVKKGLSPGAPDAFAGAGKQVVLEHTTRVFLLDGLVELLGWKLGVQGDVAEEARLKGDTTTFMDYLGVVEDVRVPVLLIEAKAWDKPFIKPVEKMAFNTTAELLVAAINHVRDNDQDNPFPALEQWRDHIEQIAGYVRGLKADYGHSLPRAVLTSGQWMVIFTDPVKTFVDGPAEVDQFEILMWEAYVKRAPFLFKQLSRSILGPTMPAMVRPWQIAHYCPEPAMVAAFKALHVRYEATGSKLFVPKPRILTYPALILQRHDGALVPVVEDVAMEFGYRKDPDSGAQDMAPHLAEVDVASVDLLTRCEAACGHALPLSPIEQFPGFPKDQGALGGEPATYVLPDAEEADTWLIATGTASHFVKVTPSTACNFHSWTSCRDVGQAIGEAAVNTSTTKSPRSFFVDGKAHHCAHLGMQDLRELRCHIAPIDRRLCCQTCLFTEQCWSANELGVLPCGG